MDRLIWIYETVQSQGWSHWGPFMLASIGAFMMGFGLATLIWR